MNINELYELKSEYERELIRAEAKVAVINDIIEIEIRKSESEQTPEPENQENSIY